LSIVLVDDNIEYYSPTSSSSTSSSSSSSTSPPPSRSPKDGQIPNIDPKGEAAALIEGQENGETERIVPIWVNSCK
jgi:hypothetical protein